MKRTEYHKIAYDEDNMGISEITLFLGIKLITEHKLIVSIMCSKPGELAVTEKFFRWTRVTNEESKHGYITRQRPDSTITLLDGLYYRPSLEFVEVISIKRGKDKRGISNDLIRLELFFKNATKSGIVIASGNGIMFNLYSLKAPSSIESLQGFVGYFDKFYLLFDIFNEHCLSLPATICKIVPNENLYPLNQSTLSYQNPKVTSDHAIHLNQ
ncbi:hypothetical protein BDC45DRAFT_539487 [Circinella umbellata]|nr:hypothetical protein BDC45DRAFT_539487 [Circinella umbellata]